MRARKLLLIWTVTARKHLSNCGIDSSRTLKLLDHYASSLTKAGFKFQLLSTRHERTVFRYDHSKNVNNHIAINHVLCSPFFSPPPGTCTFTLPSPHLPRHRPSFTYCNKTKRTIPYPESNAGNKKQSHQRPSQRRSSMDI